MNQDTDAVEYALHRYWRSGLYYWMCGEHSYRMEHSTWGLIYHRTMNMNRNLELHTYSVSPDVIPFLPGGLAQVKGPALGIWELVKSICNDADATITWNEEVTITHGYRKEELSSLTHNWRVEMSVSVSAGLLAETIARTQFSMEAEYGGSKTDTTSQDWSESRQEKESLEAVVAPGETIYIWQYRMKLGSDPILFYKNLYLGKSSDRPTNSPT